jgi:DNA-binding GntR family transcriptional regulator
VYRIRELIEGQLAAEAAKRITPLQLARIRETHEQFKEASLRGDHGAAREANFHFHAAVWDAASWPVAVRVLNALWAQVPVGPMTGVTGRESRTFKEHAAVIAALTKRDPERAQEALAAHVRSGRTDYHKAIAGVPLPED